MKFSQGPGQQRSDQPPPGLPALAVDGAYVFRQAVDGDRDDVCVTASGCGQDSAVSDEIGQLG